MMKKRRPLVCCVVLVVCLLGSTAFAQEEEERNWKFGLGGGVMLNPIYPGSNELAPMPFPFLDAEYQTTYLDVFAFGDEAGIRLKTAALEGSNLTFGVKLGQARDNENEAVESLLEGTPAIENLVQGFGRLTYLSPVGLLTATVSWLPISADYDEADRDDQDYTGLTATFDYTIGGALDERMFVFATLGAGWMNDEYAEAYHSVLYPASKLDLFDAEAGVHEFYGTVGALYDLGENVKGILTLEGKHLLGDAADSSLTKDEFQPDVKMIVYYTF